MPNAAPPTAPAHAGYTQAVPCLTYADAPAAIRWLVDVLGAVATQVHTAPDRAVAHAELWFGEACVMLGSPRSDGAFPDGTGRQTIYLVLGSADAVDALHARVAASGSRVVQPPHDTDYGSHDFTCADLEGNVWAFGTYTPSPPS